METAQMLDSTCASASIVELWNQLEKRDARLSRVESSLKQVQAKVTTWSGIVEEGLADLSVQIDIATKGRLSFRERRLFEMKREDDSELTDRLSKVEQQVQAVQAKARERCELIAQMSRTKQQVEELELCIEELRSKFLSKMQNSHDEVMMQVHTVRETCSRLERNHVHAVSPPPHSNVAVAASADSSAPQQQVQNAAITNSTPKTPFLGLPQQQQHASLGKTIQPLRVHQLPQQVRQISQYPQTACTRRPLHRNIVGAAENNRQSAATCPQHKHSTLRCGLPAVGLQDRN